MHYWRKDNFEGLRDIVESLEGNDKLAGFRNYCLYREKGLRKQAMVELDRFIKEAGSWTFAEKKEFVDWISWVHHGKPDIIDLMPHPLYNHLVQPTLEAWKLVEPQNPAPFRWGSSLEDLQQALKLNAKDHIAILRFASRVDSAMDYSTHELPSGYLGNPHEDLELVVRALAALENAIPSLEVDGMRARLSEVHEEIVNWIKGQGEGG